MIDGHCGSVLTQPACKRAGGLLRWVTHDMRHQKFPVDVGIDRNQQAAWWANENWRVLAHEHTPGDMQTHSAQPG